MPKKQKRLAANSAVLEKILNGNVLLLDELKMEKPKTAEFADILDNLEDKSKLSCDDCSTGCQYLQIGQKYSEGFGDAWFRRLMPAMYVITVNCCLPRMLF